MSEELKPCPKCGGEVECESHYSTVYEEIRAMVYCKSCYFYQWFKGVPVYDLMYMDKVDPKIVSERHKKAREMATEEWNRRVT